MKNHGRFARVFLAGIVIVTALALAACGSSGAGGGDEPVSKEAALQAYVDALGVFSAASGNINFADDQGTYTTGLCNFEWDFEYNEADGDYKYVLTIYNCTSGGITISGTMVFIYDDGSDDGDPSTYPYTIDYDASFTITGSTAASVAWDIYVNALSASNISYTGSVTVDGSTYTYAELYSGP